MILAGDIGATKTLLEAGALRQGRWQAAFGKRYAAAGHADFDDVLQAFFAELAAQGRAPVKIYARLFRGCRAGVRQPGADDQLALGRRR